MSEDIFDASQSWVSAPSSLSLKSFGMPDREAFRTQNRELTFSSEKKRSFDQITQEAKQYIGKYIPDAVPQEETGFFVLEGTINNRGNTVVSGGEYMGKVGNKHYTRLHIPKDLAEAAGSFTPEQEENLRFAIIHEYLHQAHAEKVGQTKFFKRDFSNTHYVSDTPSYKEIRAEVDKSPSTKGKGMSLFSAVAEGTATLGELHLLVKRIEEMRTAGDTIRVQALEKYRKDRIHFFKDALALFHFDPIFSSHAFGGPYAVGTINIMKGLYKRFGIKNLSRIIPQIDLDKCREIRAGSSDFDRICADPSLLPGLEQLTTHEEGKVL